MEITFWKEAPEPTEIARELIAKYHPDLVPYAMRIVFRSKARKAGRNKEAAGTAEIIRGRFAFFVMTAEEVSKQAQIFENPYQMFWMEIAEPWWHFYSEAQRRALIDHELCHFVVDFPENKEEPELALREHDIEEFKEIVHRHGPWTPELEELAVSLLGLDGTSR